MSSASRPVPPAPFITFYSFKGGVGRSMALFNVAGILAGRGFRALVIDFDLEAPGLSYLLRDQAPELEPRPGLVDLLESAVRDGEDADFFRRTPSELVDAYTYPYTLPSELIRGPDGELRILPAGRLDLRYQRRLDELDLPGLYREGHGQPLIKEFKKIVGEAGRFDVVLVDSRTGFSDESGICTRDLADHIVVVTGLNHQNIEGTAAFLQALREATGGQRDPVFVLSPVPMGEDELMDRREQAAHAAFTAAWQRPVDLTARIYYHPRLALTEEPHVFRSSRGPLYDAYAALERRVRASIGLTDQRLYGEASDAIRSRQFAKALEHCRLLAKLDDAGRSVANLILAHHAQMKGTIDGETLLEFLVDRLPPIPGLLRNVAVALHLENHPLAGQIYERVIDRTPSDANTLGDFALFLENVRKDFDAAEVYFRKALEVDPNHATHLGNFASFLISRHADFDSAEAYYRQALNAAPNNAHNLGNFANFLLVARADFDSAEAHYRKALNADPLHANNLGNFAQFLLTVRTDFDAAEAYYRRALDADPLHANHLGNFAHFLSNVRKDFDAAEDYYRKALDADPLHANHLGNFARFLSNVRKDFDAAEDYYRKAIDADSLHPNNLNSFARFLFSVREDFDAAEACYRKALDAAPDHTSTFGNFALFLKSAREDYEAAEAYYRKALDADPLNGISLGNLAQLLFELDRTDEAYSYLDRALAVASSEDLLCELHFYAYAHGGTRWPDALPSLKRLLTGGARSPGWDLKLNVQRAQESGHPEPALVAALARVVADEAPITELDTFAAWQEAK